MVGAATNALAGVAAAGLTGSTYSLKQLPGDLLVGAVGAVVPGAATISAVKYARMIGGEGAKLTTRELGRSAAFEAGWGLEFGAAQGALP